MSRKRIGKRHKGAKMVPSVVVCPKCDTHYTIFRCHGQLREINHKKWMYCYKCKKKYNFIEVREIYE